MPLDTLALGPFLFDQWNTPEALPLGGKHQFKVHKLVGGDRVLDGMGPDDRDRQFTVKFNGSDALADAQTLDALRIAGQALPYSNGAEARVVVIAEFNIDVQKFNYIEASLTLTPADNPAAPQAGTASVDSLAASDFASGSDTIATNASMAYPE